YWPWKENCGGSTWGIYVGPLGNVDTPCAHMRPAGQAPTGAQPENGCLRQSKERLLARPTVMAAVGTGLRYDYDAGSGAFTLSATARRGNGLATQVLVPKAITGAISQPFVTNADG